mgnify:CR=1 FL=1
MNKVGYLTSHASMNFGGLLQAYALQETIREMGYSCEIINYKPEVHDLKKHPIQFVMQRKGFLRTSLFGIQHHKEMQTRIEIIERFRRDYFSSKPDYPVGVPKLPEISKKYDILCVGSDQLWNLSQKDNENRVYMLDFEHSCKSFSYAISFGDGLQKMKREIEASLPLVSKFSAVSVREQEGADFLFSHGIEAKVVLDPTLMVDTEFWERFKGTKRLIEEPYILIYGFENANQKYEDLISGARKAAEMLNLPVINPVFSPKSGNVGFKNYLNCGPIEFINLVENARVLITNSFHGSIFAVLYDTPFVAIKGRNSGKDSRKANLFKLLKMEDRLVYPDEEWIKDKLLEKKYDMVESLLVEPRMKSKEYLHDALRRCES